MARLFAVALLLVNAEAFSPLSSVFNKPLVILEATAEKTGLDKKTVQRLIRRTTKEDFVSSVYDNKEIEAFTAALGSRGSQTLKKMVEKKAFEFGVAKKTWASKPYSGPPLWIKGPAMKSIKEAMENKDTAAIEAALEAAKELDLGGIPFVKEVDAKATTKPVPQQSALLVAEAEALMESIKAEAAAVEAAAAEAAAAVEAAAAAEAAAAEAAAAEAAAAEAAAAEAAAAPAEAAPAEEEAAPSAE